MTKKIEIKGGIQSVIESLYNNKESFLKKSEKYKNLIKKIKSNIKTNKDNIQFQLKNVSFDKIVSVGMFEHVRKDCLSEYFNIINNLLKDKGVSLLHCITGIKGADM